MEPKFSNNNLMIKDEIVVVDPSFLMDWAVFEKHLHVEQEKPEWNDYGMTVELLGSHFFLAMVTTGEGTYQITHLENGEEAGSFIVESGYYAILPIDLTRKLLETNRDTLESLVDSGYAAIIDIGPFSQVNFTGNGDSFVGGYKIDVEGNDDGPGGPAWLQEGEEEPDTVPDDANLRWDPNGE